MKLPSLNFEGYILAPIFCPHCRSLNIMRGGGDPKREPLYQCRDCRKYFSWPPNTKSMTEKEKRIASALIERGISLTAIARLMGTSISTIHRLKQGARDAEK